MLDDYDQVVRDHRAYVIEEDGRNSRRARSSSTTTRWSATSRAYVIEEDGEIGALVLVERGDGLLFDNIAVRPARQGEGIGRRLMEHAESEARRLGYGHLDLYTHERMTENIAMYERIGYVEVDRRTERGFPRVYMRKRL